MISVIIPVFNAAPYLDRCIQSVLEQTYSNFELILINDGSQDNSLEICQKYKNLDSRVICISKCNEGAGVARNVGLQKARGEFIGFVDSDDYIAPNMFASMLCAMEKNQADIVQCGYVKTDISKKQLCKSSYEDKIVVGKDNCFKEYCLKKNIDNYSPCKLFRSTLIQNIQFPDLTYSEDAVFLCQAFLKCEKLVILSSCLYYYVQSVDSICRRPFNVHYVDTFKAGEFMYDLTKKKSPKYAHYVAQYTAEWIRVCYLGFKNELNAKTDTLKGLKVKYNYYYAKTHIIIPTSMKSFLLFVFRISPKLYEICRNLRRK